VPFIKPRCTLLRSFVLETTKVCAFIRVAVVVVIVAVVSS